MDSGQTVAEYILNEVGEVAINHMHDRLMLHEIESQVEAGDIPDHHHFLRHEDAELRRLAMEIISSPYILSENWNKNTIERNSSFAATSFTNIYALRPSPYVSLPPSIPFTLRAARSGSTMLMSLAATKHLKSGNSARVAATWR